MTRKYAKDTIVENINQQPEEGCSDDMKTFKSFLVEMAAPRDSDKIKTYYHGTPTEKSAKGIIADGLDPTHTEIKYANNNRATSNFKPQDGRVYLTPAISYAMIYGIGGDMAGHDCTRDIKRLGQYGFVFEFDGNSLMDIEPDEDSIGEFLCRWWHNGDYYKKLYPEWFEKARINNLMHNVAAIASKRLTAPQIKRISDGEIEYWAKGGKRLLQYLSVEQRLGLIDLGAHVAHSGNLKPSKCWRFDRADVIKMKKDGSNFFEYAEILDKL